LLDEDVLKPTAMSAVTGSTTPRSATCSLTTSMTTPDFSCAASSSTSRVSSLMRPLPIQTSSDDQISVLELIDKDPELDNFVVTPRAVSAPRPALTHSSVTIPSLTSKSISSVVFTSVKHDMQPWEDTTTSAVTGSATPSTATPTSRTPRGFSAASSASITPISSAVPIFLAPSAIQTSSADQISVLKLIDDNPELHNLVATQGIAQ